MKHAIHIIDENPDVAKLQLKWGRPEFTGDDGIGALQSLHQTGDSIIAIGGYFDDQFIIQGSGVMIAPCLMLTATHVLDELRKSQLAPVFLTFLQDGIARAWIPKESVTASGQSDFSTFGDHRKKISDLSLVSCALHSDAYASYPLSLAPIELSLPLRQERLWAAGFKHGSIDQGVTGVTPLVSSGIVKSCYANGRGERMPSVCIEVAMESWSGMSGGPVYNEDGRLVGIVSSSLDGGPTYVTLVWDAMRFGSVKSPQDRVWPCQTLDLFKAKKLGLVRIKGKARRDAARNVTLELTEEQMEFLVAF